MNPVTRAHSWHPITADPDPVDLNASAIPDPAMIARIESVVRSVLAEMIRQDEFKSENVRPSVPFAGQLLGLCDAERLSELTSEILLAPGTVVTPMALDLLKSRQVAIRWGSKRESIRYPAQGMWGFAVEEPSGVGAALRRTLLAQEPDPWVEIGEDLPAAVSWVVQSADRAAIFLTGEASVATWRACRIDRVRAATVADPDAVVRACRGLRANFLVIEPHRQTIHSLKRLCDTFRREGVSRLPAVLETGFASRNPVDINHHGSAHILNGQGRAGGGL